ncbi:serine/arginine repetitive matrix protein 3-like isoform X2 [Gallus gallus]|uniref:serine/arginine repetitive matrix protein 3-like isoform X2 n=1 Tax=Gallus gallus TaxID=9031 RepID=UPI001AE1BEDC|nr:serine/arginine repetitive matrix protein 3-like isoform X2 [Gallus gallus]
MTGIIKASGGIPAERFGVSTEDLANPSSINLFKHLCILPAARPSPAPSSSSSSSSPAAVRGHRSPRRPPRSSPFRSRPRSVRNRKAEPAGRSGAGARRRRVAAHRRAAPRPRCPPAVPHLSRRPAPARLSLTSCLCRGSGGRGDGTERVKLCERAAGPAAGRAVRGGLRAAAAAGTSGSVQCGRGGGERRQRGASAEGGEGVRGWDWALFLCRNSSLPAQRAPNGFEEEEQKRLNIFFFFFFFFFSSSFSCSCSWWILKRRLTLRGLPWMLLLFAVLPFPFFFFFALSLAFPPFSFFFVV